MQLTKLFVYRCLLVTFMLCFTINAFGFVGICYNYRGQWSDWKLEFGQVRTQSCNSKIVGICLTSGGLTYLDIKISHWKGFFTEVTKDIIKAYKKNGKWLEANGTIEYYVNDDYPNAEAICKYNSLVCPNTRNDKTPCVKRIAECVIRIFPDKQGPLVWNILFDDVAIGVDLSEYEIKW